MTLSTPAAGVSRLIHQEMLGFADYRKLTYNSHPIPSRELVDEAFGEHTIYEFGPTSVRRVYEPNPLFAPTAIDAPALYLKAKTWHDVEPEPEQLFDAEGKIDDLAFAMYGIFRVTTTWNYVTERRRSAQVDRYVTATIHGVRADGTQGSELWRVPGLSTTPKEPALLASNYNFFRRLKEGAQIRSQQRHYLPAGLTEFDRDKMVDGFQALGWIPTRFVAPDDFV
jgi:hypothetical protein